PLANSARRPGGGGLRDEPRKLAGDVREARQRLDALRPLVELAANERRLRHVVEDEAQFLLPTRRLAGSRQLAGADEEVVRKPGGADGRQAALHVVAKEPARVRLAVHLVAHAAQPPAA